MDILSRLSRAYIEAKGNRWFHYFAVFCRFMLALGFVISGIVKIKGERFASGLSVNNPMGHYLEALHHTEFYYTFIGISQLIIALLLLFRRTAALGAMLYFPVILNICVLAYAVRFEGTRITTFMLLASLYLVVWYYDRIKYILPFQPIGNADEPARKVPLSNQFSFLFFGLVIATLATVVVVNVYLYDIRPGNSQEECTNGCPGNEDPVACQEFCDCLYNKGKLIDECLANYNKALEERTKPQ
ncbi:DoxX family protein [Salmonirosea aquatica]|uniref:DoxX family protein n=1 Tax=Salmonirosea aquatica TaxID=2654236 RepID=A0A7C9FEL6_9BACT|nr:DoxX family protein [Cytophagaceae bacterium SJW1-29]